MTAQDRETIPEGRGRPWGGFLVALPLVAFLGLASLFYVRLGAGDASRLPSALIGKPVPNFSLPILDPATGTEAPGRLTDADLRKGNVSIVNMFASWCAPCREDHPFLQRLAADAGLAARGVRVIGIAYKDALVNTRQLLREEGNPFAVIGVDEPGRVAIDWGVYGVPETFIVGGDGTIAYRFVGPMSDEALSDVILPEIDKASK